MKHQILFETKNDETALSPPVFTVREQEIIRELLAGASPKEIAYSFKISYNTVLGHQRKIYRKLGINTISELLTKYSISGGTVLPTQTEKTTPVFTRWRAFKDDFGSFINVTSNIEYIQERYITTFTIQGKLSAEQSSFTGVTAEPDISTLESMKKMSSFSFSALGDGNSYKVMITTSDAREKSAGNHYRFVFTTNKHEIQKVNVKLKELCQSPLYGTPVPFIQSNIELFQIMPHSTCDFNLKIWEIKFNK
ncbi:MAG: CIA30 family protein [Treponema sp.]|nr:CIA30 family protein [Treponema sp.]